MSLIISLATLDNIIMAASGTQDDPGTVFFPHIVRHSVHWDGGSLHFLAGYDLPPHQRHVLKECFLPPSPADSAARDLPAYMQSQYAYAAGACLDQVLGPREPLLGSALIAVYGTGQANHRPHLFRMQADLSVAEASTGISATGGWSLLAAEVLTALGRHGWAEEHPDDAVTTAMEVTTGFPGTGSRCRTEHLIED